MVKFNNFPKIIVISLVLITLVISGCKEEKVIKPAPTITSSEIFSLGSNAVTIKSEILNDKDLEIAQVGLYWSNTPDPKFENFVVQGDLDSGNNLIYCRITGLSPNTKYYAKVYATNAWGTGYSEEISFTTNNTVNDIMGYVYNTVTIGTQVWMVENLRTIVFNDGQEIPYIAENASWDNLPSAFYCWYDNNEANKYRYGALYNYPAVISGRLCPVGWHVPSDAEWATLTDFLGEDYLAGGFLKATETIWEFPNERATNYSGFSATFGGSFSVTSKTFLGKDMRGVWWSSTIDENDFNIYRELFYESSMIDRNGFMARANAMNGLSVRCIKD